MAPLLVGFAPKSRSTILIRNCLHFVILHRFVPKSRRTILLRNQVHGATSHRIRAQISPYYTGSQSGLRRHTILIGISAGVVMRIEIAAYYAGWHCRLQMVAVLLGALLATAADPAPTQRQGRASGLKMVVFLIGALLATAAHLAPGPSGLQMVVCYSAPY